MHMVPGGFHEVRATNPLGCDLCMYACSLLRVVSCVILAWCIAAIYTGRRLLPCIGPAACQPCGGLGHRPGAIHTPSLEHSMVRGNRHTPCFPPICRSCSRLVWRTTSLKRWLGGSSSMRFRRQRVAAPGAPPPLAPQRCRLVSAPVRLVCSPVYTIAPACGPCCL